MAGVEITGIGIHPFGRFDGVTVTDMAVIALTTWTRTAS